MGTRACLDIFTENGDDDDDDDDNVGRQKGNNVQ